MTATVYNIDDYRIKRAAREVEGVMELPLIGELTDHHRTILEQMEDAELEAFFRLRAKHADLAVAADMFSLPYDV